MPMPSLSKVPVPLSSFPAFWRRRLLPLLLAAFLLLFSSPISSAHLQPRSSCAAHFLNGEAAHTTEAVLPIKSSSGNIFWLLCHFPTLSSRLISVRPSLSTDVHNALAGQWWTPPPPAAEEGIKNADGGKVIGIGYQVSEWQFMRSLITESFDCKQRMCIRWPDGTNGRPAAENQQQMFTMETFSGQSISVRRNQSGSDAFHDECVLVPSPPLIRLRLPLPRGIAFYLEPLTCRQKEVPPSECHFELRTDSDRVRVRLDALRNKWPKGILSFSFRTSKPNGRLLELGTGQSSITGVDLIDGYLLLVNHIVHPVRLLADGTWHSLNLDLHSMALRVDGQGTAISLVGGGSPVPTFEWMFILLVGEVGAFRLVEMPELVDQDNSTQLLCQKGRTNSEEQFIDMIERPQKLVFEPLFGGSTVCASKNNFCNCKGPNSALSHGVHQTAECAESVSTENAFHLSRFADRLAFFIVPKFGPRFPISVLLQSEESTGLVLFGVYTLPRPAFGELGGRVQVHFVGDTVYGSFCSAFADGTERCLSCAIRRPKAFPSPDWVRFSLFYQQNLQFLAVDRQVCLLSPNSDAVDAAELYKITETNVLFVGGTFYAKIGAGLGQRVSDSFRRQFQDNTREKEPSIQGCIAEIVVKRQPQHLDTLFELQKRRAARTVHPGDQIFAMRRGCANCALGCDGAPCVRAGHGQQSECQCGQIYAITDLHDARCGWTQIGANPNGAIKSEADDDGSTQQTPSEEHDAAVPLPHWSLSVPIRHPLAPGVRRPKHLDRVWTLFRMPDANSELKTFLRIGGVRINVGNNGQQLVVEVPEFAIREEFTLRQGADSRLHLLSLELSPSVGTGYTTSSLTIRLDNDRRKLFGYAEIPLAVTASPSHHLHDAGSVIEIGPAILPEGKSSGAVPPAAEGDTAGGGGCIAALVFNYVPTDEGIFADEQKSLPSFVQIDYVPLFRHILQEQQHKNATFWWASAIVAAGDGKCLGNVVDPTIWETNSTSWGRVWVMDNSNDEEMNRLLFSGQTPPGNDGTWSTRLSLLVTTILVAVILLTLLLYGIMRCRNRRRFRCDAANCKQLKNGVFAARIEQQTKQTEEKRPLRSNEEEGDGYGKASQKQQHLLTKTQEATNNSEIWRNGGGNFTNGFVDQRQIGHADDHGGGRSAIATALVNSNGNTEMVVEQLDGSPKYSGGVGGNGILPPTKSDDRNFIATPLLHGQQQHQRRRMLIPAVADTSHVNGGKYCSNLTGPNSTAKDQTNDQQHEFLMRNATPIRVLMANGGNSSSQSSLVADIGTKSDAKRTAQQQKQCQLRSDQPADQTPCAPIAQKDEL